jgi:superfamily I DNA/RNA helicase
MAWDQDLDGKALSIAATECKYMRVMAGPGTGKTFAMKRRVARLLEEGCELGRLFVATFTRVAAAGLVKELLGTWSRRLRRNQCRYAPFVLLSSIESAGRFRLPG